LRASTRAPEGLRKYESLAAVEFSLPRGGRLTTPGGKHHHSSDEPGVRKKPSGFVAVGARAHLDMVVV
jgi:hypothetical protein